MNKNQITHSIPIVFHCYAICSRKPKFGLQRLDKTKSLVFLRAKHTCNGKDIQRLHQDLQHTADFLDKLVAVCGGGEWELVDYDAAPAAVLAFLAQAVILEDHIPASLGPAVVLEYHISASLAQAVVLEGHIPASLAQVAVLEDQIPASLAPAAWRRNPCIPCPDWNATYPVLASLAPVEIPAFHILAFLAPVEIPAFHILAFLAPVEILAFRILASLAPVEILAFRILASLAQEEILAFAVQSYPCLTAILHCHSLAFLAPDYLHILQAISGTIAVPLITSVACLPSVHSFQAIPPYPMQQ